MRRVVLIANPGKRVDLFCAALHQRGWPPAVIVPWIDLLNGVANLDEAIGSGAWLRIESPGRDFEVEQHLLLRGVDELEEHDTYAETLTTQTVLDLHFDKGRIYAPHQWYLGWCSVLVELEERYGNDNRVRWVNHPHDIAELFDKRHCQALYARHKIAVPRILGSSKSFPELMDLIRTTGCHRVFVKLACGSSGSGVVAFAVNQDKLIATTTVELVRQGDRTRLYNNRRIRRIEDKAEVQLLFDTLCREGVQVEQWVPKAVWHGQCCDVRVLMIAGEPQHTVVRRSKSPITNLHLRNDRCGIGDVQHLIAPEVWNAAIDDARTVARLHDRSLHVGVDIAFTPGFRRHVILEANAFGDLLPGLYFNALSTYEAQLAAMEARP